jgi:hypothetical protein
MNIFENSSQPVSKLLLSKIGKRAFPSKTRAAVIRVSFFLDFRRHFAIVVSTGEQAPIGKTPRPKVGLVVATDDGLDLLKALCRDNRSVGAQVKFAVPPKLSFEKRVFQNFIYLAFR